MNKTVAAKVVHLADMFEKGLQHLFKIITLLNNREVKWQLDEDKDFVSSSL